MPKDLVTVRGRRIVAPAPLLIDAPRFARLNASALRTMFEELRPPPLLIRAWLVMLLPVRLMAPFGPTFVVTLPLTVMLPLATKLYPPFPPEFATLLTVPPTVRLTLASDTSF